MVVLVRFRVRPQWHRLGQDRSRISNSELACLVVQVGFLLQPIVYLVYPPGAGHVLGSKGSSTSSESSAAPRLVEGKRVKWLSDEDVFGYADVIGMCAESVYVGFRSFHYTAENLRPLCPPLRDDDCYLYLPTHSPLFGSLEPVTLAYGVSDGRNDPDTVANIDPYPTSLWLSPSPTIAPVSLPVSEPPRIRIEVTLLL